MRLALIAVYDLYSQGVRGLHSYAAELGAEVNSFFLRESTYTDFMCGEKELEALTDAVAKFKPDFVGIAARSPVFPICVDIIGRLRKKIPGVEIILGGAHATAAPKWCANYADYVVVGDGEYPLGDILGGCDYGILPVNRVTDLDSLPLQHYGPGTFGFVMGDPKVPHKFSVYSQRGCFFNCSYCQESLLCQKPVRKSVKKLKEEILYLRGMFPATQKFTFSDSVFLHDMDWLEEFASEFSSLGLRFWCAATAPLITDEMLKVVKSAGVEAVRIGVQSGSEYIRSDIFNRKDTLDQIRRVAKLLEENEMMGHYDFIFDNPYETPETLKETRDFIRSLPKTSLINKFEMRYWPGTRLTKSALNDGLIEEEDVEGHFTRLGNWTYMYGAVWQR